MVLKSTMVVVLAIISLYISLESNKIQNRNRIFQILAIWWDDNKRVDYALASDVVDFKKRVGCV
jgi:hypothetical protein